MVKIYNSFTRRQEEFAPITPGKVGMYVCGMTVYDHTHVGHARVMIVFDVVARYLRARGFDVRYVRNITDIDDKIIRRAAERGEAIEALTARFIEAMHEDERALGVLPPDAEPRATRHIDEIVAIIEALVRNGYAYRAENGDVYYRVRKFDSYGMLSGKSIDELQSGARVEVGEAKEDPLDFVLWKAAKPGDPSWDSPWGPGRPGWHIECSAMSTHCLGEHFDIHGGGMDLRFPHHENEIAQSEGATGGKFVNYWMHVGFVRVNQEKMSKSLGNFFTVREVLPRLRSPEVLRFFILASHYRSPLDYSDANLRAAEKALDGIYIALKDVAPDVHAKGGAYESAFQAAMDDDFNTPRAFAVLQDLSRALNRAKSDQDTRKASELAGLLVSLGGTLGLFQSDPDVYLKGRIGTVEPAADGAAAAGAAGLSDAEIENLVAERTAARKGKDWAESDRIRDQLKTHGVILEDSPSGTTWRRA